MLNCAKGRRSSTGCCIGPLISRPLTVWKKASRFSLLPLRSSQLTLTLFVPEVKVQGLPSVASAQKMKSQLLPLTSCSVSVNCVLLTTMADGESAASEANTTASEPDSQTAQCRVLATSPSPQARLLMFAGSVAVKVTVPSPPGTGAGNSSFEQDVHRASAPMAAIARKGFSFRFSLSVNILQKIGC